MKKTLVFVMAMALGVTASSYAANPFSDVPSGHWAYDSIERLAAAGIVDGYGDGTYRGGQLMTRYEMAQIVAKALAKGANVDRLASEFAKELDSLGVRVANLEKNADNVKITGQVRYSYRDVGGDVRKGSQSRLRTRLMLSGAVNDDWRYVARLENNQYFHDSFNPSRDSSGEEDTNFNWAYVDGRLGGTKVTAGRQNFVIADTIDTRGDGIKVSYGKNIKLAGWFLKAASDRGVNYNNEMASGDKAYILDVGTKFGETDANLRYYKTNIEGDNSYAYGGRQIYELVATAPIAKDLKINGAYYKGAEIDNHDGDKNGYLVGVAYKGARAANVGSWGIYGKYSDRPLATYIQPTVLAAGHATYPTSPYGIAGDGYKGYEIGANYTVAKNMVGAVKYTDFKQREDGDAKAKTIWSELVVTF